MTAFLIFGGGWLSVSSSVATCLVASGWVAYKEEGRRALRALVPLGYAASTACLPHVLDRDSLLLAAPVPLVVLWLLAPQVLFMSRHSAALVMAACSAKIVAKSAWLLLDADSHSVAMARYFRDGQDSSSQAEAVWRKYWGHYSDSSIGQMSFRVHAASGVVVFTVGVWQFVLAALHIPALRFCHQVTGCVYVLAATLCSVSALGLAYTTTLGMRHLHPIPVLHPLCATITI